MKPRGLALLVLGLALLLPAALAGGRFTPQFAAAASSSTPTAAAATGYDGEWIGDAVPPGALEIKVMFTVHAGELTSVAYQYPGQFGTSCTRIDFSPIRGIPLPRISPTGSFSADLAADFSIRGQFDGPGAASGHLHSSRVERINCSAQFDVDWRASRKAVIQPAIPSTPANPPLSKSDLLFQLLIFGLSNGAILALNAIGVTVIYSTVRTLNLAHGDVFALTTALVTSLVNALGLNLSWPPLKLAGALILVLAAAVLFGMVLSVIIERIAFKPFRGRSQLAPLMATLGISFILFQAALVWRTFQHSWIRGEHRSVPGLPEVPTDGIPDLLPGIDLVRAAHLPFHFVFHLSDLVVLLVALGFVAVTVVILQRTALGRGIRASAQNADLAQIIGVDVDGSIRRAFALGGALAGAAAFVFALYYSRPFGAQGAESGLLAFATALVGGIGNPAGALASGLFIGAFSSFSDYYLSAQWTPVLLLAFLVGLLVLRPTGILSRESDQDGTGSRDTLVGSASGMENPAGRRRMWVLLAVMVLFPFLSEAFGLGGESLVTGIGIFMLLALGLNLLLGLAGVLDLGYAVSFGVGGYLTAILTDPWGRLAGWLPHPLDFSFVLLACVLISGLFGALKGMLAGRMRGDYLAVATLAIGLLGQRLVVNLGEFTGGASGMAALPPAYLFGRPLSSPIEKYFLVFIVVGLAALVSLRLTRSRTGRAWLAGSDDELAAAASGVDIGRSRLTAFVLGSILAGLGGALYASVFAYIDPGSMAFHISTMTLTMVILGGAGSVPGAILGAAFIVGYDKILIPQLATALALFWPHNTYIGPVPDIRGTSFFNFGLALYLTVLLRGYYRARKNQPPRAE